LRIDEGRKGRRNERRKEKMGGLMKIWKMKEGRNGCVLEGRKE